jgi:hypothetical protein
VRSTTSFDRSIRLGSSLDEQAPCSGFPFSRQDPGWGSRCFWSTRSPSDGYRLTTAQSSLCLRLGRCMPGAPRERSPMGPRQLASVLGDESPRLVLLRPLVSRAPGNCSSVPLRSRIRLNQVARSAERFACPKAWSYNTQVWKRGRARCEQVVPAAPRGPRR